MEEFVADVGVRLESAWDWLANLFTSPQFYTQLALIAVAAMLAVLLASSLKRRIKILREPPRAGALFFVRNWLYRSRALLLPLLLILLLGLAADLSQSTLAENWLIRSAQGLAAIAFLYLLVSGFVQNPVAKSLLGWVGVPIVVLYVFGWLDELMFWLDSREFTVGNLELSLGSLLRTAIFGALLFWLGAISNTVGKNVIRTNRTWNVGTRELVAKLFEIGVFFIIFMLFLEVLDINLTALAVFGGAVGIGLGFGLQQIASNFISGVIILLDRSVMIGDYIELEDGRSGWLRELNMRHGILETYDGKDIMVPNELFITSSYTNWTHKDKRQRYSLNLQVAYSTDLDRLFERIRAICIAHPKVLSGPSLPIEFQPDAEIAGFGESGIDILVEFWMNGIDDGENRVGADLLHSIWNMIKEQGFEIPFPQREIRVLAD